MEPYYETIDRPGWYRYYDATRPPVVTNGKRFFYENGEEVTSELGRESSNEFHPPPAEPWDPARYELEESLGEGTQASVGKYKDLKKGHVCAIKHYELWVNSPELREKYTEEQLAIYGKDLRDNVIREIAIMATLSSDIESWDHLVRLIRWHETHTKCDDHSEKYDIRIVMFPVASELSLGNKLSEQFESPNFKDIIPESFPEEALLDLAKGLNLIHQHTVRHKDINAENVVLNKLRSGLKLLYTDFGISLYFDPQESATGISANDTPTESTLKDNTYAAPELLDGKPRSTKSDVFSLGCLVWEILAAKSVPVLCKKDFMNTTGFSEDWGYEEGGAGYARLLRDGNLAKAFAQMRAKDAMKEYHWMLDVIERMTKDDPVERLSAAQVVELAGRYIFMRETKNMFIESEWDLKLHAMDSREMSGTSQLTRWVGKRKVVETVYST